MFINGLQIDYDLCPTCTFLSVHVIYFFIIIFFFFFSKKKIDLNRIFDIGYICGLFFLSLLHVLKQQYCTKAVKRGYSRIFQQF